MWRRKTKKRWKRVHEKRRTARDGLYLQRCRVRWTIGSASGNHKKKREKTSEKKKEKRRNQKVKCFSRLTSCPESWAYSWTRANRGYLIYKKCDIFVFSVGPFFPFLWRVTAGHKYLYFFFLNLYFSLSLWVWIIFALLLFDIVGQQRKIRKNMCVNIL